MLDLVAYVHPDDLDEIVEQLKAILAYYAQEAGVTIKVSVSDS